MVFQTFCYRGINNLLPDNILEAILPDIPDEEKETPTGFSHVGHVG